MAAFTLTILSKDGTTLSLQGDRPASPASADFTVASVVVTITAPTAETDTLSVVGTLVIPGSNISAGASPTIQPAAAPVSLGATLRFGGSSTFFGKTFDATSGLDAELVMSIPAVGGSGNINDPFLALTCRGRVEVGAGPIFAAVALGFRVVLDDIPSIPSLAAPALELELPGDIRWPRMRLDWPFPKLPDFAPSLRLPAFSIGLDSVPVRVGWKSIDVTADSNQLLVHLEQLRLTGVGGGIDGSLDLTFKPGKDPDVAVNIPALNGVSNAKFRTLGPGCFGFDWDGSPANPLLQLVTTELSDPTVETRNRFQLRVHASDRQLEEIRLDWRDTGLTGRTISLPGFALDLPAPRMLSLIARRQSQIGTVGDGESRLTLAATFDAAQPATARTTFSWPLGDERQKHELFRDGQGTPSDSLLSLIATTKNAVSLVLFDLPLESDGAPPRFVQQLAVPLAPLEELENDAGADGTVGDEVVLALSDPCPPSELALAKLSAGDFALDLKINGAFVFPFLNDASSHVPQLIRIKSIVPAVAADLSISCVLTIEVQIGDGKLLDARAILAFDPETMSFRVDHDKGIVFLFPDANVQEFRLFDLTWRFLPAPSAVGGLPANAAFVLVTKNGHYQLRQAPGTKFEVHYDRVTVPGEPIVFRMTDFALGPKGVSVTASITDQPARLNGLETRFRFTEGVLQIKENRIAGFTIAGSGPLPPALVGDAVADVALQFEQKEGALRLVSGAAQIKGSKLLSCKASRFEFELDGLGLRFVEDHGSDHLYFTLSGKARYKPLSGDDSGGALSWLPSIEIQLVDCPLTGNMRVIAQHVNFLIELPRKLKFSFLGCFQMELRAIGFVPQFDKLGDNSSAMQITGQIMFAEGGGDVLETKVDFHSLYVALPKPGSFVPRVHLKGLGIKIKQGELFELYGAVDFFDDEVIEPGIRGKGFSGEGSITIQGLPTIAASFAFMRVSADQGVTWKRAWFLYLEARKLALMIPVIEIYIREIGLGFGYRYTLAGIKTSDQINDPKQLLKELKKISKTQGNLSRRDQWRVDLEGPGEGARWTVALRALIAQTSASQDPFGADYSNEAESVLPCLFVLDVVIALRSDLTFFMAGRAWLDTNYHDFRFVNNNGLQDKPLFSAFVLLSPRQKRFLANLSSNQDAEFGDHPPLPEFIKTAIRSTKFSATLLIEPGLVHYELGWPNQLQWRARLGPLIAEFRGGAIFRVSTTELVVGNSFLARGTLTLSAEVDLGFVGASLSALAQVAYGARYIGVLAFVDSINSSAFYGAIGVEIRVVVDIHFWLHIKLGLFKISFDLHLSFSLNFTASLEVGITLTDLAGARGTATLAIGIMGHDLHFGIRVGINDGAVDHALSITERFLHIGLEAEDVDAVPGTGGAPIAEAAVAHHLAAGAAATRPTSDLFRFQAAASTGIQIPNYSIATAVPPSIAGDKKQTVYFLLVPAAATITDLTNGFYPPPPSDITTVTNDIDWSPTAHPASVTFEQFRPLPSDVASGKNDGIKLTPVDTVDYAWKFDWDYFDTRNLPTAPKTTRHQTLRNFLRYAFLTTPDNDSDKDFGDIVPVGDPPAVMMTRSVADERVGNPSERAFESAVRGASEQFISPYFKYDPKSEYDANLRSAFSEDTSPYATKGKISTKQIIAPGGLKTTVADPAPEVAQQQRASQLRGAVIQAILRDFHRYADLDGRNASAAAGTSKAVLDEISDLEHNSMAFRLGLVFCATADTSNAAQLSWLEADAVEAGTIKQRMGPLSPDVDSGAKNVVVFNKADHRFTVDNAPEFAKVSVIAHAKTVAITWELRWRQTVSSDDRREDPEHQLRYYKVRRLHLNGNDPEVLFTVKKGDIVHTREVQKNGAAVFETVRLLARFQLVDHFDAETGADVSALTEEGKSYLYTIIPIDLAGLESPRPLSIVATRYPSDPPQVPTDGELVVEYPLEDSPAGLPAVDTVPLVRDEMNVYFQWSDPPEPVNLPVPPIATYRLVFRRESTLPVGFYGADQDTRGGRASGFPITNARTLRTDLRLSWTRDDTKIERGVDDPERPGRNLKADTGRLIFKFPIDLKTLVDQGILPPKVNGVRAWRPEAWRVFVQTVTPNTPENPGVPSALAAVVIRIRFVPKPKAAVIPSPQALALVTAPPSAPPLPLEERQMGLLEWLPNPIRFNPLPPEDQQGTVGFARVPMPALADPTKWTSLAPIAAGASGAHEHPIPGLTYEPHPDQTRAIRFIWNQGPSNNPDHPLDLHARYQLYEFDADAKTGDSLVLTPDLGETTIDFHKWVEQAGLRLAQEIELLPADDLPLVPSDTLSPLTWEAWYPSLSRRLLLVGQMKEAHTWPSQTQAKLSPWFSWRDSYLLWPDPMGLVVKVELRDVRVAKFHPFLQAIVDRIKGILDPTPEKFSTYTVEVNPLPARGGSSPEVNPNPPNASGLDAFLKDTALATDPFGWNVLQRMGLSVAFRVRHRVDGKYVEGLALANLVRSQLQNVPTSWVVATGPVVDAPILFAITAIDDGVSYQISTEDPIPLAKGASAIITRNMPAGGAVLHYRGKAAITTVSPAGMTLSVTDMAKFLHVEHLFQPGKRTSLTADDPTVESLLALVQVSLRPALQQRMQYRKATVSMKAVPAQSLTPGQLITINFKAATDEASFLIQSGTLGDEVALTNGTDLKYQTTIPPSGELSILLRGKFPVSVAITLFKSDGSTPIPGPVKIEAFPATRWESTHFKAPDTAPWATSGAEKTNWRNLTSYMLGVRADLKPPTDPNAMPVFLSWLDRFFGNGGDVAPLANDDTDVAATGTGPWVASAYPRAATPIALTPDTAGRITYDHLIEDLWAHVYRYYIRPQGRYDLIWASIGFSQGLFKPGNGNSQEFARRRRQIDPPDEGGLDMVLERFKPLAPPLVLSSRRLDAAASPGHPVAPGAIWEVLIAKHTEQDLIEKNRSLVDHLGFRHLACTILRSFAFDGEGSAKEQLAGLLGQFVSGLYVDVASPVATNSGGTLELIVGAATQTINLSASNRLDEAVTAITNLHLTNLTATIKATAAGPVRLVLKVVPLISPVELRTVAGDPTSNLLSHGVDLGPSSSEPVTGSLILEGGTFRPSGLPEPASSPEWLDPKTTDVDDALSLDLPLRLGRFGQGAIALQYRALPFYYKYKMLVVAQASAVVSPVTEVNQADFHYVSPVPSAAMEGIPIPGGRGRGRARRIVITLGRFWDSLAGETQARWEIENPDLDKASVKRRDSSLPDPGVIYQVVVTRPSGVVETLAEYRFNPIVDPVSGYESRALPGAFRGDVVRLLPPPEGTGAGAIPIRLETHLTRTPAGPSALSVEPVTGRRAFAAVAGKVAVVSTIVPQSCVLRIDGPLDADDVTALRTMINDPAKPRDVSFAVAVRSLLAQPGPSRIAEASVGLEQLAEVSDTVVLATEAVRKITWNGAITAAQLKAIQDWEVVSLFAKTLDALLKAITSAVHIEPVAANPANPSQASLDPAIGSRLTIGATRITWSKLLTDPPTPDQITKLRALHDLTAAAGLTEFAAALNLLIAVTVDPSAVATTVDVVEAGWHERPAGPPDRLKDRLLVGYGLIGFTGLMTRDEAAALLLAPGLTAPDKASVARLFAASLNSGFGEGKLQISARRGSAPLVYADIAVTLL